MPKVSVLVTNYNSEKYIGETIESIVWQTFTDFELIILDDRSSDKSWSIIQKYQAKDIRIRCYQNEKNLGISLTRNKLIDLAQWSYVAWLDSDDRARPERLERQVHFLDTHPEYGIVGSWMVLINGDWKATGKKYMPITNEAVRKQWYFRNSLNHPTLMMRMECIKKTGYYDPLFDGAEDYDFWIRAGMHCMIANIPEFLTEYRIHNNNISIKKHKKTIRKTLLVRKKMQQLGYPLWILGKIAYILTWCIQYIPPYLTVFLFYRFISIFWKWKK